MTQGRYALVISCSGYQDPNIPQLVAPSTDAKALSEILKDPSIGDYEVNILLDEPSHKIRSKIQAFFSEREKDDLLLFYFAGHGIKDIDGTLYLAGVDTNPRILRATGISL